MTRVQIVDCDRFDEIRDRWNGLLENSGSRTSMITWEWMHTWWKHYRQGRELYLLAVFDEEDSVSADSQAEAEGQDHKLQIADHRTLLGIAPLVRRKTREYGIPVTRVEFIGTGEAEEDETCSEYLDIIATQGQEVEVAEAVAKHLCLDSEWDEIVLKDVRTDIPSVAWDVERAQDDLDGSHVKRIGSARCPFITLPPTWDEYLSSLSTNSRKQLRYKRKRLGETATIKFCTVRDRESIAALWPRLVELHQARWETDGKSGCFASPLFSSFLEEVSAVLAEGDGVQLSYLEADDEIIAIYHVLRYDNKLFYYNSGVLPGRYEEHSPGNVCMGYIIEEAINDGVSEFHFYKGAEGSYKYHWTDTSVSIASLRIRRRNWRTMLVSAADIVKSMVRRMPYMGRR